MFLHGALSLAINAILQTHFRRRAKHKESLKYEEDRIDKKMH